MNIKKEGFSAFRAVLGEGGKEFGHLLIILDVDLGVLVPVHHFRVLLSLSDISISQVGPVVNTFSKVFSNFFQPAEADRLGGRILAHEAHTEVADVFKGKITAIVVHGAVHEVIAILDHIGEDFAFFSVIVHCVSFLSSSGFLPLCDYILSHIRLYVNPFLKVF